MPKEKIMKITVTHEIDAEAWSEEWGVPLNEVRADAKNYIFHGVAAHLDHLAVAGTAIQKAAIIRRLWE